MEINILKSSERGVSEHDWLSSKHSFSFANYHNPSRMNFGLLRVFNDDKAESGMGFGMHRHDNMEIISIVLEGSLEHRDSMGNHGIIKEREVQRISAGTGISHSESNHSKTSKAHFLQVWVEPNEMNLKPSYEQKSFLKYGKNKLNIIVSGGKNKNSLYLHQDAVFSIGVFDENKIINYMVKKPEHGVYIFIINGNVELGKNELLDGDSAEIRNTEKVEIKTKDKSAILVIEVPMTN